MDKVKRVLHVIGYLGKGGDTTAVLNILKYLEEDEKEIMFDFITHKGANEKLIDSLRKKGSRVYILSGDARKIRSNQVL